MKNYFTAHNTHHIKLRKGKFQIYQHVRSKKGTPILRNK